MPTLEAQLLADLRKAQLDVAMREERCRACSAQTWPNYCREHDEFFTDGHWPECPNYSDHSLHRRY